MSTLELVLVVLWLGGLAGLMVSWLVHRRRERRLRRARERLDAMSQPM
jgi:type II secretory pathway pseudopilin PulG